MKIVFSRQGARPPDVERAARRAAALALPPGRRAAPRTLQVVWTSREIVRALNRRFRGVNRYTDVIAFRYEGGGPGTGDGGLAGKNQKKIPHKFFQPPSPKPQPLPFGDVFIAVPQARLNARRFGVPFREELVRLVVHGVLHLLGYTDYAPRERKKMWAVQERVLREALRR